MTTPVPLVNHSPARRVLFVYVPDRLYDGTLSPIQSEMFLKARRKLVKKEVSLTVINPLEVCLSTAEISQKQLVERLILYRDLQSLQYRRVYLTGSICELARDIIYIAWHRNIELTLYPDDPANLLQRYYDMLYNHANRQLPP
jgi:hypothetical protein